MWFIFKIHTCVEVVVRNMQKFYAISLMEEQI